MRYVVAVAVAILAAVSQPSWATNFYVDPDSGDDSNAGISHDTAWRTIPGTRRVDDSGWVRLNWGKITPENPLQAGDSIVIRAGTRIEGPISGRLLINNDYYAHGTEQAKISIVVSDSWGDGPVVYSGESAQIPQYYGLVTIDHRDFIELSGSDDQRRLVIDGSTQWGLVSRGSAAVTQKGVELGLLTLSNARIGGANLSFSDSWIVYDSTANNNGAVGFSVGGMNDERTESGIFLNAVAHSNGAIGFGGIRHGFALWGGVNISYLNCLAYDNVRDGFDFGTATNAAPMSAIVVNSVARNNGEDGFAANGGSMPARATYVKSLASNNSQAGWNIYDGATADIVASAAVDNGRYKNFGGNFMVTGEQFDATLHLSESVAFKPGRHANVYSYRSEGGATRIISSNNVFVPRANDNEVLAETPYGTERTYTNLPAWLGDTDRVGSKYTQVAIDRIDQLEALINGW